MATAYLKPLHVGCMSSFVFIHDLYPSIDCHLQVRYHAEHAGPDATHRQQRDPIEGIPSQHTNTLVSLFLNY